MKTLPDFDQYWDFSDPASTEKKFKELLPLAEASGVPAYHSELLTQIARTLGLQRRFEEAHEILDEVENSLTTGSPIPKIRYLLERGRVFNSSGNPVEARPKFLEAYELSRQSGVDNHAVDAAHMVAIVEENDTAVEWNLKAVAIAEKSSLPGARKWLGSLYNNLGWTYHDAEKYDEAMEMFNQAHAFHEMEGNPRRVRIARWCVARCHRSLGNIETALNMQVENLEAAELAGESDGYIHEELAECYLALERDDEAAPHFSSAYHSLSQDPWLQANEPRRLERLKKLGGAD